MMTSTAVQDEISVGARTTRRGLHENCVDRTAGSRENTSRRKTRNKTKGKRRKRWKNDENEGNTKTYYEPERGTVLILTGTRYYNIAIITVGVRTLRRGHKIQCK